MLKITRRYIVLLIVVILIVSLLYLGYISIINIQSNISITKISENNGYYNTMLRYGDRDSCFTFLHILLMLLRLIK